MVEVELIKKRRRKRIAAIVGGCSAVLMLCLGIIAFLGQYVGTFTVALRNNEKVNLSSYDNKELTGATTFLRIGEVPSMVCTTAGYLEDHDAIDNPDNGPLYGGKVDPSGNVSYLGFFKYTFFIRNTGNVDIDYNFNVFLTELNKPDNIDYDLTDLLRIRIYEHAYEDATHLSYKTYAKESLTARVDEKGNKTFKKPVSGELGTAQFYGFADPFVSDTMFVTIPVQGFTPGMTKRYTVVFWLEGYDEKATGTQPTNCSMKLGAEFIANVATKKS